MREKSFGNLKVYQNALELSELGWEIYLRLSQEVKFGMGNQFIRSVDSIGANIAEGYGRFHYRDKVRFYYNARGSLWESKHWVLLLFKRDFIDKETFEYFLSRLNRAGKQLNRFIASTGSPNDQ
ncbi:four helix bundle protein [Nitratifractor sp.]